MGKVSNECTCPDRTYENCQRTSRCARCGNGYCTYGYKYESDRYCRKEERKGYCCSIWDNTPITNRKSEKSNYDRHTAKIVKDNFAKFESIGLKDYQNLGEDNWEKYTSNKVGRYPKPKASSSKCKK